MYIEKQYIINRNISDVYDFFSDAENWGIRVNHCSNIRYIERKSKSGQDYEKFYFSTESQLSKEKICTERWKQKNKSIVYNQVSLPFGLLHHSGEWVFEDLNDKTKVTSRHIISEDFLSQINRKYNVKTYEDAELIIKNSIIKNSDEIIEAAESFFER